MVKNIKGGKGHKSIARKSLFLNESTTHVRLPENSLELFAVVTKFYGNLCDVTTHDKLELKCHIRGKFKGKSKRNAYIVVGKIILVGLRHYETTPKNCDLLHVFEATSYSTLSSLPSYNLNNIFNISSSISTVSSSCSSTATIFNEILFSEEINDTHSTIYSRDVNTKEDKKNILEKNQLTFLPERIVSKINIFDGGIARTKNDFCGNEDEAKCNVENTEIDFSIDDI